MPKKPSMSPRERKEVDTSTYAGKFAARLRTLREKVNLSVEDVAEKLGVKPITVYQWEQGRSAPSIEHFPAIAAIFKIKVRNILPEE